MVCSKRTVPTVLVTYMLSVPFETSQDLYCHMDAENIQILEKNQHQQQFLLLRSAFGSKNRFGDNDAQKAINVIVIYYMNGCNYWTFHFANWFGREIKCTKID